MIFKEAIVAVFQSNSQVGHSRPIFPGIDVKANSMLIKKKRCISDPTDLSC